MDRYIRHHFIVLTISTLITVGTAVILYNGPFQFWHFALSDLGAVQTKYGTDNAYSRTIFTLGFLVCAYLMARMSQRFWRSTHMTFPKTKGVLCGLSSVGFGIFVYPHDLNKAFHALGAGLMVGSIYLLVNLLCYEMRRVIPGRVLFFYQLMLHGSVLLYAAVYAMNAAVKQVAQKICFASLIFLVDQMALVHRKDISFPNVFNLSNTN